MPRFADPSAADLETLKSILEHIQNPDRLDSHPWVKSLFVQEAPSQTPETRQLSPGHRLLKAISGAFAETMPSLPPRRGVRLDTQWGEFGILAARYFAPLTFSAPMPTSLRDAWGRIDQAILLFVAGHASGLLFNSDVDRYRLVGKEPDVAPDSTLSDWHRKGLQQLADLIAEREKRLRAAVPERVRPANPIRRQAWRALALAGLVVILLGLAFAGVKGYRIYQRAMVLKRDYESLRAAMPSSPDDLKALQEAGTQLPKLDRDLTAFRADVQPVLWMAPMFSRVPVHGGEIAQANDLLDFGQHLVSAANEADTALGPLLDAESSDAGSLSIPDAVAALSKAQPQLLAAGVELKAAQDARSRIDVARLSPTVRELLVKKVDPTVGWMSDGLAVASALPSVLGAGKDGPQTYLLVAQNEDELRPTGGFITSVGKLVLDQSHVVSLTFENSGDLDNWSMPYPMAPWQLSKYMNSRVLILRDTNWFPDFPTGVLYLKQLYAYTHQDSVDGVIAFDQQMLVRVLKALGPVQVSGVSYPITADNVIEYMRQAKTLPAGQPVPEGWSYKAFVGPLARAIVDRILISSPSEWTMLSKAVLQGLDERHLLLQIGDRDVAAVVSERGWEGSVSSSTGDFLMVLDSNVGFTKSNAVVDTSISYDVDLSDLTAPRSQLLVSHTNGASKDVPCIQWAEPGEIVGEEMYPIDRCYWDYMRVYVPDGTSLQKATPQIIPDTWMILNTHVEPTVDTLDEGLPGLSSFGTLIVVPGGGTINTGLTFALPAETVLSKNSNGSFTYRLSVRKQPGTAAVPITIRLHLPSGAQLVSPSPNWKIDGTNVLIEANLKVDLHLDVTFRGQ